MSDERPDATSPAGQLLVQVDAAAVRAAIRSDRQPDEGRRNAYEALDRLVLQRDAYKERAEKAEEERDRLAAENDLLRKPLDLMIEEMEGLERDRNRLIGAIADVVPDLGAMGRCTYPFHDGDRKIVDDECPGAWCYLIAALTDTEAGS